jgi:CubicO group peptidase (beta-lactamase class C family)
MLVDGELGQEVNTYLETCESWGFSGAVLAQKGGKVIVRKGYGLARWHNNQPNSPTILFHLGQTSMHITAAAILLLESQGKLDTSASIAEYLPNVPKKHEDITVYDVLTHTSGFPSDGRSATGGSREDAHQNIMKGERKRKAGKAFELYENGYAMLLLIVEQVTQESFEEWVDENLFKPNGLKYTFFAKTMGMDEATLSAEYYTSRVVRNFSRSWTNRAANGVMTSVADLAIWCNALFAGKVLPPASLERMLTAHKGEYGCGWSITNSAGGRKVIQHGGTAGSWNSFIRYFPEDDVLILVLTNRPGWHQQVAWGISGLVLDEPNNTPPLPETIALSDAQASEFCGIWEDKGRRIVVQQEGDAFSIGCLDATTKSAVQGDPPTKPEKAPPKQKVIDEFAKLGMEMVTNLCNDDVSLIEQLKPPLATASWPQEVLSKSWPEHLARWGAVQDQELLTAFSDPQTTWIYVYVRLTHEKALRTVKIAFYGGRLKFIDLGGTDFHYQTTMLPIEKRILTSFDGLTEPPAILKLIGKGKSRKLELIPRDGKKIKLKLVKSFPNDNGKPEKL